MNKIIKAIKNPYWLFGVVLRRLFSKSLSDKTFIKLEYLSGMGKFPNLDTPTTYNEKLQWLKLNDIHNEYTHLVDKYEVKEHVKKILGENYIIPTLGVWDKFEDIDFNTLPEKFVLKTTHDSGGVVICTNKNNFNINKAKEKINKSLNTNYFYEHREYPYKKVKPRIIAEKYMVDESGIELKDYKFYCFDGKPQILLVVSGRNKTVHDNYYDIKGHLLPFIRGGKTNNPKIILPNSLSNMVNIAEKLCSGFRHVRIDLYDINGKIYFGEYTFFPGSGNVPFEPKEWDKKLGSLLNLPS